MTIWRFSFAAVLICGAFFLAGCQEQAESKLIAPDDSWEAITRQARGQTVNMAMWDGDPMINAYMRDYVAPELKKQFGIELKQVGGQGNELVNKLLVDLETGRKVGDVDLMWINGETFYQLRKMNALDGPFTERLPNNRFIDWSNPFIAKDFQQPVDGFECPWGNVQLAIIYDSERVSVPPKTSEELTKWVQENPGRFTFDNSFTGMTFLKGLLMEFAEGPESLQGPFDDAKYQAASQKLWNWLRGIQPYLWRKGETFPESVSQLHQLFSNGEVDFSMSNNDGEVDNKVEQGILPKGARAYVLDFGTIRNSHYLGIPRNAPHKAAALVLANFLISPEAQHQKALPEVWGDGTVLSLSRLPESYRQKFEQIEGRTRVAPREELEKHALAEPASEVMVRLHEDFRREIIEHKK
ncbi:MAG: ABC transporter substrate-binding protein [Planctomycetaceae bacterium]